MDLGNAAGVPCLTAGQQTTRLPAPLMAVIDDDGVRADTLFFLTGHRLTALVESQTQYDGNDQRAMIRMN